MKEGSKPSLLTRTSSHVVSMMMLSAIYILRPSHVTPVGAPLGFSRVIVALPCTCIITAIILHVHVYRVHISMYNKHRYTCVSITDCPLYSILVAILWIVATNMCIANCTYMYICV